MKKIILLGIILLFSITPCSSKKEKKQLRIYYNNYRYKYDDEVINIKNETR